MNIKNKIKNEKFLLSLCNTLHSIFEYKYVEFLSKYNKHLKVVDHIFKISTSKDADCVLLICSYVDYAYYKKLKSIYKEVIVLNSKFNDDIDHQYSIYSRHFRKINTFSIENKIVCDVCALISKFKRSAFCYQNDLYVYDLNLEGYRQCTSVFGKEYLLVEMFMYKFLSKLMLVEFMNYKEAKDGVKDNIKHLIKIDKSIKANKC